MPLRVEVPKGRGFWYIRGTVHAGKRSRSVYESTGIGAGDPRGRYKAEKVKEKREPQLIQEVLTDPLERVTFTEAAADYGAERERERIARNPALKGQPDKEMEYVAKWVTFHRARGLADIPLTEMCTKAAHALATYFDEKHIQKGNKLSTMHREADTYHTVMNHAAGKGWAPEKYPRAQLPDYDILEQPVNKWLYPEEIMLFIRLAPKHLTLFTAGVFATGIRGGELLFVSRRRPSYQPNTTGLSLEPGQEHIFLGYTKSGKPIIRALPDWWVEMIHQALSVRTDAHDALFLTETGEPYLRPRKQRGFLVKTAWRPTRERVAAVIERLARRRAAAGDHRGAERLRQRAAICREVTPHWGRHNAASHLLMKGRSKGDAKRAGGWSTDKMLQRYEHLAPEANKGMANELDFGKTGRAIRVHPPKKAS
jgi:hypothetical protein